jgi:RNA polymerase sigma factor (sigma-70 family)
MSATDLPTPESLLRAWKARGEPDALGALFDAEAPGLFRLALSLCPDAAAAEDALQETFVAVLERPEAHEEGRPVGPWLAGILRHKVQEVRRRDRRAPDPGRLPPAAPSRDPVVDAADAEARSRVRAAILELPEPYRSVALLRWRHGLEPAEIAEVRGEPPGTVSSTLHRAAERLRARLPAGLAPLQALAAGRGLDEIRMDLVARARLRPPPPAGGTGTVPTTLPPRVAAPVSLLVPAAAILIAAGTGWLLLRENALPRGGPGDGTDSGADASRGAPGAARAGEGGSGAGGGEDRDSVSDSSGAGPGSDAARRDAPGPGGAADTVRPAFRPSLATALLRVRARAAGALPKQRPIAFNHDCGRLHAVAVPGEDVVPGEGDALQNVVVFVASGAEGWSFAPATDAVVLDQRGCIYTPHVLALRAGQPIEIRNSDPCMHNVHSIARVPGNIDVNETQFAGRPGAATLLHRFPKPEVGIEIRCDIHTWMKAFVHTFDHPFHGVTGKEGRVDLRVPPGVYTVAAWHEAKKVFPEPPPPRAVRLADGETVEVEFVYSVK